MAYNNNSINTKHVFLLSSYEMPGIIIVIYVLCYILVFEARIRLTEFCSAI